MKDAQNIGSTQAVQDPQDAIEAAQGTYKGNAEGLTDQQKYPNLQLPAAPEPQPFTVTGGGSGTR